MEMKGISNYDHFSEKKEKMYEPNVFVPLKIVLAQEFDTPDKFSNSFKSHKILVSNEGKDGMGHVSKLALYYNEITLA